MTTGDSRDYAMDWLDLLLRKCRSDWYQPWTEADEARLAAAHAAVFAPQIAAQDAALLREIRAYAETPFVPLPSLNRQQRRAAMRAR